MPDLIKPAALSEGSCIGVMAPGSYVDPDELKIGQFLLESNGFTTRAHPQTFDRHHQSAGTPDKKADAFHSLLMNDDIEAIMLAGGGNRTLHFLCEIDMNIVIHNPKPVIGFSDCTALLGAVTGQTGIATIHGPTVTWLSRDLKDKDDQIKSIVNMLMGEDTSLPLEKARVLKPGKAKGPLYGGNLSLVMRMIGTKWCPDLDGAILYLEDVGDELSWIDRDLWYLRETGVLKYLAGIVFGSFSQGDSGGKPFGFSLDEIIMEHMDGIDIPVIMDAPFGHGDYLYPLPFGTHGVLEVSEARAQLTFDSPVGR